MTFFGLWQNPDDLSQGRVTRFRSHRFIQETIPHSSS